MICQLSIIDSQEATAKLSKIIFWVHFYSTLWVLGVNGVVIFKVTLVNERWGNVIKEGTGFDPQPIEAEAKSLSFKKNACHFQINLVWKYFFIFIIHFKFVTKELINNSHKLTLIICHCKVMAEWPKRYRSRSKSLCATHPLMLMIITERRMDQQTDGTDGVHQIYPNNFVVCVCVWYNNSLIIIILNKKHPTN